MINIIFILFSCLYFLLGATYTVGTGKDYTTIQGCVTAATTAGDVCDVYGGSYAENVSSAANGILDNYITLQAHTGETVNLTGQITISHDYNKIDGLKITHGVNFGYAVTASGNNNIISNIYLKSANVVSYGILLSGNYNTVSSCEMTSSPIQTKVMSGTHNGSDDQAALTDSTKSWTPNEFVGMKVWNGTDSNSGARSSGTITANTATSITATLSGGTKNEWDTDDEYIIGSAFYIGFATTGTNNTIDSCYIHDMAEVERVFEPKGNDNTISNNRIYNLWNNMNGFVHQDIFQVFNLSDVNAKAYNIIIEKNEIRNVDGQIGSITEDAGSTDYRDWTFRNNVFYNSGNTMSDLIVGFNKVYLYNNTFYCGSGSQASLLRFDEDTSGHIIKNNLFIGCGDNSGTTNGYYSSTGTKTANYNYVSSPSPTFAAKVAFSETNGINGGDPKFTNIGGLDFTLQPSSPAIDKGETISGFSNDKNGVTRGAAWDIGAYEYYETGSIRGVTASGVTIR